MSDKWKHFKLVFLLRIIGFMKSAVYCDNEDLKKSILNFRPSVDGLFPHELAMISYADAGQLCAKETTYSGVFTVQLKVDYPAFLLESLVSRDYICILHSIDNLMLHRTYLLQEFAKKRNLKHPNNRKALFDIITQNCSVEEINSEIPLTFYLPTGKGKLALEHAHYNYSHAYLGWAVPLDYFCGKKLCSSDITVRKHSTRSIKVVTSSSGDWKYYIEIDGSVEPLYTTKWTAKERQSMLVLKDNRVVFSIENVDCVDLFYSQKLIGFHTLLNSERDHYLPANITIFDLCTEKLIDAFFESQYIKDAIGSFIGYVDEKTNEGKKDIIENDVINYYVSSNSRIAEYIFTEYPTPGKKPVKISALSNYTGDETRNIVISVSISDTVNRNLLQHMINEGLLGEPSVFGIPVREIGDCFYLLDIIKTSKSKLRIYSTQESLLLKDKFWGHEALSVLTELEKKDKDYRALKKYVWSFPPLLFDFQPYRRYDPGNVRGIDNNWLYAKENPLLLRQLYNTRMLDLRERGIIPSRWVNEFNLFLITKEIYPDSIFQYRATWLGQQSLDIFIPSEKAGIEYQGKQHYEPVDIFGGIEGFQETQKRDFRKKELCKINGISLLEWHYSTPINKENVSAFLNHWLKYKI